MSLIKNSIWNLSGYIIPSIIMIPALGYLARSLGAEQFGLYTLCITVVGYAGVFDAGISRAVIREIAIYRDDHIEKNNIITSSLLILFTISSVGAIFLYVFSSNIVSLLNVSDQYFSDMKRSIGIVSIALPVFLITQVLLSVLEGQEYFKKLNAIKTINNSILALFPALFVYISNGDSLYLSIVGLLMARLVSLIICLYFCLYKENLRLGRINKVTMFRLVKFGGWITITNIISPIMNYFDRFILSNIMGSQHVAFYTAPSEGISKLSVVPGALSRAIFPKLSSSKTKSEREGYELLGWKIMLLVMIPITLFGMIFAQYIMVLWMGSEFSGTASIVFQVLLIGLLLNACALLPYSNLQSLGYANVTAYIHIAEIFPYLYLLYELIGQYGVVGAAIAWTIRMFVDCILLLYMNKICKV